MALTDLRHYIRIYEDDLTQSFCQRMIESFHSLNRHHRAKGRGYRRGLEDSVWTELDVTSLSDEAFRSFFRVRIDAALGRYNRDVGLNIEVPNSRKTAELIIKRYRAGGEEKFQQHFDSINEVANRYFVLLWYLNDVAEGGETVFPQIDVKVAARRGRLLVFPPYWMFQHAGLPPLSNEKFILSTYLLF